MKMIKVNTLDVTQRLQILALWNQEYPIRLQYDGLAAFDNYLAKLGQACHYLLLSEAEEVLAWMATFDRDQERWFVIIVGAAQQGKGVGRQLLSQAKEDELVLNAWVSDLNNDLKANGEYYRSPLSFYFKNGFELLEGVRLDNEQVSAVKIRWSAP